MTRTHIPVARRAGTLSGDRQLLKAAALGDTSAWDALVETYAPTVWFACRRCGLQPDEAAAASQLVWLSLADANPHLDVPLATWLVASATHEAYQTHLRASGGQAGFGRDRERRHAPRTGPGAAS